LQEGCALRRVTPTLGTGPSPHPVPPHPQPTPNTTRPSAPPRPAPQLYTGQRAYAGLNHNQIVERVIKRGARPAFPPGAPPAFIELATACWAAEPGARPGFDQIIGALEAMLRDAEAGWKGRSGGAGAAAAAPAPAAASAPAQAQAPADTAR
jgi:hypothetical protein